MTDMLALAPSLSSALQDYLKDALVLPNLLSNQRIFANYLDMPGSAFASKNTPVHRKVVLAVTMFIANNLRAVSVIQELADYSWSYGELVEAERVADERRITISYFNFYGEADAGARCSGDQRLPRLACALVSEFQLSSYFC